MENLTGSMCIDQNGLIISVTGELNTESKRTVAGNCSSIMRNCKKLSTANNDEAPSIIIETSTDKCIAVREYDKTVVVLKANIT